MGKHIFTVSRQRSSLLRLRECRSLSPFSGLQAHRMRVPRDDSWHRSQNERMRPRQLVYGCFPFPEDSLPSSSAASPVEAYTKRRWPPDFSNSPPTVQCDERPTMRPCVRYIGKRYGVRTYPQKVGRQNRLFPQLNLHRTRVRRNPHGHVRR